MRILLWHGYLLGGTGSNVYTRALAREWSAAGHDDPRAAEVVALGMPLLADDGDVVAGVAPLARERARVDVGARTAEQVAVPEQDPHGGPRYVRWK